MTDTPPRKPRSRFRRIMFGKQSFAEKSFFGKAAFIFTGLILASIILPWLIALVFGLGQVAVQSMTEAASGFLAILVPIIALFGIVAFGLWVWRKLFGK